LWDGVIGNPLLEKLQYLSKIEKSEDKNSRNTKVKKELIGQPKVRL